MVYVKDIKRNIPPRDGEPVWTGILSNPRIQVCNSRPVYFELSRMGVCQQQQQQQNHSYIFDTSVTLNFGQGQLNGHEKVKVQ